MKKIFEVGNDDKLTKTVVEHAIEKYLANKFGIDPSIKANTVKIMDNPETDELYFRIDLEGLISKADIVRFLSREKK